jgi:subtilase family serine protease
VRLYRQQSGWSLVIFTLTLLSAFGVQAAGRQVLAGHVPAATATQKAVDHLPATQSLHLAISLPLRNQAALDKLLKDLYDPASPSFHHFLNPAQFAAAFGTTEKDYQAVVGFAKTNGLAVTTTHKNRLLLEVDAPVADVERVFHVKMGVYQHPTEKRTFYSPDVEPSLDLDIPLLFVAGLNNYEVPHSNVHLQPLARRGEPIANGGAETDSTFIGLDFRAAYVPGVALTGTGQSVGLLEFDSYYPADVTDYLADANGGLTNSAVAVTSEAVASMTGYPQSGESEVALDIDMAISMAPGLSKVVVYEAPGSGSYADALLNAMANDDSCAQLSCSWSGFYDSGVPQAFAQFAAQGQTFFIASGDDGAYTGSVAHPCDNTNITVVGGTTLSTTGPQGSWTSEVVWSWFTTPWEGLTDRASSGGISTHFSQPVWQQGLATSGNGGSSTARNIPDVAMCANEIFLYADNGSVYLAGGTSAAAPLWAGFMALVNQHGAAHGQAPLGFLNPALYAIGKGVNYNADFHDVTSGNNTNLSTSTKFFATTGYDLCTGWGSPNGSNMINALLPSLTTMITPTVTWAPAAIVYGTALSAAQLNATTTAAGTFTYATTAGTVLNAGTNSLSVVFTPLDTYDYNSVTTMVSEVVTTAPLSMTTSNVTRVYGQSNPMFAGAISGLVNGDSITASYTCSATTFSAPGSYPILPILSDPNSRLANYTVTTNMGQLMVTAASSTNVVLSSKNPAGPGSNVTFTATLTAVAPGSGTPTGTVQFYADGAALGSPVTLAGGVASTNTSTLASGLHVISNYYAGDGNFWSSSNSVTQVVTGSPTAANVTLSCYTNSGAKISVTNLLANDSDPLNEALSLVSAGPASTNGGTVAISEGWIFYTPPSGVTNADAFPYVISDTNGMQATGMVFITLTVDLSQSQDIVAVTNVGNSSTLVQFQGIPGRAYTIQYTNNQSSSVWQTLGSSTANATGAFSYTDTPGSGAPTRTYRSIDP